MPIPSTGDLHVSAALSNLSIRFMRDQADYIGSLVSPVVPVAHKSDTYHTYDRADWFREAAERRAPGTESAGGGWRVGTDTYSCVPYAIHKDIDDPSRANADSVFSLDSEATEYVAEQLLMKYENLVLTKLFESSAWTGSSTGADQTGVAAGPSTNEFLQFNDNASTPIEFFKRLKTEMHMKTGKMPNTLVVGPRVMDELEEHPDIAEKIKYTQKALVTAELIAGVLGIPKVLVARYSRVTTAEGLSATYAYQAGTGMWMGFVEPSPGLLKASAMYAFSWSGYTGTGGIQGLGVGTRVKKFRMEPIESDRVEGAIATDVKRVGAVLGIRFATAVA